MKVACMLYLEYVRMWTYYHVDIAAISDRGLSLVVRLLLRNAGQTRLLLFESEVERTFE